MSNKDKNPFPKRIPLDKESLFTVWLMSGMAGFLLLLSLLSFGAAEWAALMVGGVVAIGIPMWVKAGN
jgi:hypothetical protein